jgi:flagella basal body P-ring formation protein FlgA
VHGEATINDNIPLIEKALTPYLDDGLEAADWYAMLNRRVFFWVTKNDADRFLQAKAQRPGTVAARARHLERGEAVRGAGGIIPYQLGIGP